jgi:hypothetical protein
MPDESEMEGASEMPGPIPGNVEDYAVENPTVSAQEFYEEQYRVLFLNVFVWGSGLIAQNKMGDPKVFVEEMLREQARNNDDISIKFEHRFYDRMLEIAGEYLGKFVAPSTYKATLSQMSAARAVDNFQTYLKEIVMEVVESEPRVLSSSEVSESHEYIFGFGEIDNLHRAIARERIRKLFFKGFDQIVDFFEERLGVDLFANKQEKKLTQRLIEYRNLIVHNRGRINRHFLDAWPDSEYSIDENIDFEVDDVFEFYILTKVVAHVDEKVSDKFAIDPPSSGNTTSV